MNSIISSTGLTMSSREIADLTGSTHDNVLKTIRALVKKGVVSGNETPYVHPQNGQTYKQYELDYRNTMIVVSGYNVELRARIIDRWMALEKSAKSDPLAMLSDPAAMRGILLSYTEKVIELQSAVDEMRPAVEALEQIAEAHGSFTRTEAAKHLGVAPQMLCRWMTTNGWTYRRAGSKDDIAYQSKITAGYLEHKVTTGFRPDDTEWISTQVRVTPKGLTVLAKAFPKAARAA